MTSLKPPASPSDASTSSKRHPIFAAYPRYMAKRSEAKRPASSPPVPARISRIAFLLSASSLGISASLIFFSISGRRVFRLRISSSAMDFMSGSSSNSTRLALSLSALSSSCMASTTGERSAYSRDNLLNCSPLRPGEDISAATSSWRVRIELSFSLIDIALLACF